MLGLAAVLATAAGVHELLVLAAGGAAAALAAMLPQQRGGLSAVVATLSPESGRAWSARPARVAALVAGGGATMAGGAEAVGLWRLFAVFVKSGAVLFGSGYVLLALLRAAVALLATRINSAWIILAAAVVGLASRR